MKPNVLTEAPHLTPAQDEVFNDPHRFRVVLACRRFGKTMLGAVECLRAFLDGNNVLVVSPDFKMAYQAYRTMKEMSPLDALTDLKTNDLDLTISSEQATIIFKSAEDNLQRKDYGLIHVDEPNLIRGFEDIWQNDLRPVLVSSGGRALFTSSYKKGAYFQELYERGQKDDPEWKSWRFTVHDAPFIAAEEIESLKTSCSPRSFSEQFLCEEYHA